MKIFAFLLPFQASQIQNGEWKLSDTNFIHILPPSFHTFIIFAKQFTFTLKILNHLL